MNLETCMFHEAGEAPAVVRSMLERNREPIERLGEVLRKAAPRAVVTVARGSSDHASTFAKYLIETRVGVLASSAAPSISSVYAAKADLDGVLCLAISQSGASPDLLSSVAAAKSAGALIVALVNADNSPLSRAAHHTIALHAGPEASVAATKSYIASLATIIQLVAAWTRDPSLSEALGQAPTLLDAAWRFDWSAAIARLQSATNLYVIGRGLGLGIAQEAALKFKETCGLHAEAFSAAELRHGPMALVRKGFPVLVFAQHDETHAGIEQLARDLRNAGADLMLAGAEAEGAVVLPTLRANATIEPLLMIQSFYRLANALAITRGRNPDRPPHLSKVTETV
ncbi:MAG TPA: SIS domain-containing protein [Steroidobacteraceae bacterium]|nr:SIS domain-containing protein [Steroidobacteraceae bacterium]